MQIPKKRGMIKWDASHPIRWISSRGIYSEHWIGIAEKQNKQNSIYLSILLKQLSVCPSVCLSGCLFANYSHISWQICSEVVPMDASCIEEGYKTILKQIHENLKKFWQNSFGPFVCLAQQQLTIFDGSSVR